MAYKIEEKDNLLKMYKNRDVPNLQSYIMYMHPIQYNSTIVVVYCRILSLVFTNDRFTHTFRFAQNPDTNVIDFGRFIFGHVYCTTDNSLRIKYDKQDVWDVS